ncbi:MAG: hypothetical protein LUQ67_06165, partial [Methanomicrobiales archaeon]|nr:hypothetical protein [Methanomicrobiales archaeon]
HEFGCTFTQGYWKTHTKYDVNPKTLKSKRDDRWDNIDPSGEDSPFFVSPDGPNPTPGQTWYDVFLTEPSNANGGAYYSLAHQYMAAVLNSEIPASTTPEVDAAMADAKAFFEQYTPTSWQGSVDQSTITDLVDTLTDYNEGGIGPGHCDEK